MRKLRLLGPLSAVWLAVLPGVEGFVPPPGFAVNRGLKRPVEGPLWLSANTQEKGPSRQSEIKGQAKKEEISASKDAELAARLEAPVGRAKAKAPPQEGGVPGARREKQPQQQAAKGEKQLKFNPLDIPIKAGRAARRALERLAGTTEPAPTNPDAYRIYFDNKFLYAVPRPNDTTPTVLVVGATGETGIQAVRKLILKGYRVQVLVRKLYSTTLNMLGTGVSYVRGDLTDVNSLKVACDGVDKVLFLAQANNETEARAVEYRGLRNLVQAFQDTRITESGRRLTTKRTLFKFRKSVDFEAWGLPPALLPAGAEASWAVQDAKSGRPAFSGSFPASQGGEGPGASRLVLESKKIALDLSRFGGFVALFKAQGDPGVSFRLVIRTAQSLAGGYQFELPLPPVRNRYLAVRMNFKDFVATQADGSPYAGVSPAPTLEPGDVRQLAVVAVREGGEAQTFSVLLEGIKVFRAQANPDFVVLSSSDITPLLAYKRLPEAESSEFERIERRYYYKAQGELALKVSGLAYCIIRMSDFSSNLSEGRPLSITTTGNNMGLISRADAAEVCVNCLFNPKVVNSELYASENPRMGERNIPRLLDEAAAELL